jgi:hypothetical protein
MPTAGPARPADGARPPVAARGIDGDWAARFNWVTP